MQPSECPQPLTCTKRGMVLRRKISMRFMGSRARMCSAPVQPSTISSIFTPSCQGTNTQLVPCSSQRVSHARLQQPCTRSQVILQGQVGLGEGEPLAEPDTGTHCVGLLCASCCMPLGILVSLDQQLDQAGDDSSLLERGMVGRAQRQVADQTYGSLGERRRGGRRDLS